MRQLWICPSRGRPANVHRLAHAWAHASSADLLIALDADDPTKDQATAAANAANNKHVKVTVGPRLRLCGTLNAHAQRLAAHYDAIGFLGDDHVPRTPAFDTLLGGALRAQGGGLAYGNDLLQGELLPTAVLQDARLILALGQYAPPELTHLYLDDYWRALGQAIGKITYLPDVIIEHLHPIAGKTGWDPGYTEVNSAQQTTADREAFAAYLAVRFPDDVRKATEAFT